MSISFYGMKPDGKPISLDDEDPAFLNMASANGRAFLNFLGIDPGDELTGEFPLPEARRAAIKARALFDKKAGEHTREASDTKRPGHARFISGGIDVDYLARRLDAFDLFLKAVAEKGATSIYWA